MVTLTTLLLFAATWLLFGGVTALLWRRTARAIAREDALRISVETMLMRSRFRDAPPVSPAVLTRVPVGEIEPVVGNGDGAGGGDDERAGGRGPVEAYEPATER